MAKTGLHRSSRNRMIAGVMGGIAERFGWDVTLVRIIFVLTSIFSVAFPGIVVYLVLWVLIPKLDTPEVEHSDNRAIRTVYPEDKHS